MAADEKSLTWIVVASVVFVAVSGWGFLAGSYVGAQTTSLSEMSEAERQEIDFDRHVRGRRSALGSFVGNALEQLPNMPAVISWHLSNRIWLPMVIALVLAGVVGGGFVLKKVEQNLSEKTRRRR